MLSYWRCAIFGQRETSGDVRYSFFLPFSQLTFGERSFQVVQKPKKTTIDRVNLFLKSEGPAETRESHVLRDRKPDIGRAVQLYKWRI